MTDLNRALAAFTPYDLAKRHGGQRESTNQRAASYYEWLFHCNICHSDRLRYNELKRTFICWGCNVTGGPIRLVEIVEQCTDLGAMQFITEGYVGGDNKLDKLGDIDAMPRAQRAKVRRLPKMGVPHACEPLREDVHAEAWRYLRKRGITPQMTEGWALSYVRSGWLARYLIFPVIMDHAIVYWQGRAMWDPPAAMSKEQRKAWVKETSYRKTLNPPRKGKQATPDEVLYNYDRASTSERVVICEGPIDAIKIGSHAVATFGKSTSPVKIERLARMKTDHYVIYRDHAAPPDPSAPHVEQRRRHELRAQELAGAHKLAAELSVFGQVSIATPPAGTDAGDHSREENARIIEAAEPYRAQRLVSGLAV